MLTNRKVQDNAYFREYRARNRARINECYRLRRAGNPARKHYTTQQRNEMRTYGCLLSEADRAYVKETEAFMKMNEDRAKRRAARATNMDNVDIGLKVSTMAYIPQPSNRPLHFGRR